MKNWMRSLGFALVVGTLGPALQACGGADTGDEQDQTATQGRFETFVGVDGQTYFQLLAGNGEKVLRSEGYSSLSAAKKGITSVRKNGGTSSSFQVLQAASGFYFNLVAGNGQIIATSETYAAKSNATRAVKTVVKIVKSATSHEAATGSAELETFKGQDGKTYFHLRATNGEIILQSEGYASKSAAEKGIESVEKNGVDAASYSVIEAQNGQFYFDLAAANGEVIGRSQMYASKANAERGADTVRDTLESLGGTSPGDVDPALMCALVTGYSNGDIDSSGLDELAKSALHGDALSDMSAFKKELGTDSTVQAFRLPFELEGHELALIHIYGGNSDGTSYFGFYTDQGEAIASGGQTESDEPSWDQDVDKCF